VLELNARGRGYVYQAKRKRIEGAP